MKAKYTVKFMPDYETTCLWPVSNSACADFEMPIPYAAVGLSANLTKRLDAFGENIMGLIDWNDPAGPPPMPLNERIALYQEGRRLLSETAQELGPDFEVIDGLDWIKPMEGEGQ